MKKKKSIFLSTHIITQKGYLIIFSPVTNQNYLLSISSPKTLTLRPQQRNYTASVFLPWFCTPQYVFKSLSLLYWKSLG